MNVSVSECVKFGDCTLHLGDNRIVLKTLPANSVDSVVCDPPYEIDFMGKGWDRTGIAYDVAFWREVLRVLKPGGHLLAASASRTYHRMTCAIEDAGFEIRDMVDWMYGSGFPKSHNLGGDWDGWGTALKPAKEPFVLARKPLIATVAENVARHGTGALNIDACRVGDNGGTKGCTAAPTAGIYGNGLNGAFGAPVEGLGRWPANVIHDGSPQVIDAFPMTASGTGAIKRSSAAGYQGTALGIESRPAGAEMTCYGDNGSAARFFYCAKATVEDREHGLRMFEYTLPAAASFRPNLMEKAEAGEDGSPYGRLAPRKNIHPTVKPTELMRYLCRLITPPGGTVLDPFMGSGSTGRGAKHEGFRFIGIEMEAAYFEIAAARIKAVVADTVLF